MILWTFIWLLYFLALAVLGLMAWNDRRATYNDPAFVFGAVLIAGVVAIGIPSLWFSADAQSDAVSARSDPHLITSYEAKRNELVPLIEDQLSAEQFTQLLAAYDSTDLLVIFGDGASDVLLSRAGQIVDLNARIQDLRVGIVEKRKSVCDYRNNPLTPHFPFGLFAPECELDLDS